MSENPFDIKALDDGLIWYRINLNRRGSTHASGQLVSQVPVAPQRHPVGEKQRLIYDVRPLYPQTPADRTIAFGLGHVSGPYAPAPHRPAEPLKRPIGRPGGRITKKQPPLTYKQLPPEEVSYQPERGRSYQQRPMIPTSAGVYEALPMYPAENV